MRISKNLVLSALLLAFLFSFQSLSAQTALTVTVGTLPSCNHDGKAWATVSNGTPPYTYAWTNIGHSGLAVNDTVYNIPGGYVMVTVTDANGLTGYGYGNVMPPFWAFASTTPDTCLTGVGTATVNVNSGGGPGSGIASYLWSNGQTTQTATGLVAGTYDCLVTDSNGCTMHVSDMDTMGAEVMSTAPFVGTTNATPSSCNDGTLTLTIGGTPGTLPYTFLWNTNPVQTTQNATNLPTGSYSVRITDATGCYTDVWGYVPQGTPPFNVTSTVTNATCQNANGSVVLNVTGAVNPVTYLWSTGATTSSITNMAAGYYSCLITDGNGCPGTKYVSIGTSSPITLSMSSVISGCQQNNGTATATPAGGTAPYTYLWSNGQTTATATGLAPGYYSVWVEDVNGCRKYGYTYVGENQSCLVTITGRVVWEAVPNCVLSGADYPVPYGYLQFSPGGWVTTNSQGYYTFTGYPGTYTISHIPPTHFSQNCPSGPATITVNASTPGGSYPGNNFFDEADSNVNDLMIYGYPDQARPGFTHHVYLNYRNIGSTIQNATVSFTHDAAVNFSYASPMPSSYNAATRTLTWGPASILPHEIRNIHIYFAVPINATTGSILNHSADVSPIIGDATPVNNTLMMQRTITNSWDPNFKEVDMEGQVSLDDSVLNYTLHFQNTGTDTAYHIVLRDTLDADLEVPTFQTGISSHPFTYQITGQGIVEFSFMNIMLPDSNIDEPGSHGFVTYRIEANHGIQNGTYAHNTGHIYFDFNPAVVTNTTQTLFGTPVAVQPTELNQGWAIFPNPTRENVFVRIEETRNSKIEISVSDITGRIIQSVESAAQQGDLFVQEISYAGWPKGIYLISVKDGEEVKTGKLVVE